MDEMMLELVRYFLRLDTLTLIFLTFGAGVVLVLSLLYAWEHVRDVGRYDEI